MRTKLTLRLEQRLIRRAKAYARRTGKSVSELVADFFGRLEAPADGTSPRVLAQSPAVQSLVGALAESRMDEPDYRCLSRLATQRRAFVRLLRGLPGWFVQDTRLTGWNCAE